MQRRVINRKKAGYNLEHNTYYEWSSNEFSQ